MSKNKTRNPFESVMRNSGTDARTVIGIPILLLFLGIFTRWVCGSPLDTLHYVGARPLVPQTWIIFHGKRNPSRAM